MELLSSIAIMGGVVLALFIGACICIMLWDAGFGDSSPVLLEQMLRRQGDEVARRALASGDRNFAHALRQCTRCIEAAQCRAWLHSGASDGYQTFCPNAGYVQRIKLVAS
jgi:hypothetical protein